MKKSILAAAAVAGIVTNVSNVGNVAYAQSSVTLYGIIDEGIAYQNNQATLGATSGGHANTKLVQGVWAGSRWGLKGDEDLGGGNKAFFLLESSFSPLTGTSSPANGMFGRRSFLGLANKSYGTVAVGRQDTAYYTLLLPYSPIIWLTGYVGAHPGDIDSLDSGYRSSNTISYMSPSFHGLTVGGSYALAGTPGSFNNGSTWSAGLQYIQGPFGIGAAILKVNNAALGGGPWSASSTDGSGGAEPGLSALTYGYRNAQAQQRIAVTGGWQFSSKFDISVSYSNVQYIPGISSGFHSEAVFNTVGAMLHYRPTVAWDLAVGYADTRTSNANGITDTAHYRQVNLSQYYNLSKRTGIYVLEGYQRATGLTYSLNAAGTGGSAIAATASVGDGWNSTPSSNGKQFIAMAGIIHRF